MISTGGSLYSEISQFIHPHSLPISQQSALPEAPAPKSAPARRHGLQASRPAGQVPGKRLELIPVDPSGCFVYSR